MHWLAEQWLAVTWTEWLGFLTGLACVYLVVKQNPWTWPIGILNNIFFLVLFWRAHLFADSLLQIFYMVISVYGLWNWLYGGENHSTLAVSKATPKQMAGYLFSVLATTFGICWLLKTYSPSTTPWGDAFTTALSLTAQYMMTRKRIENWWLWITADVVYIWLYMHKNLYLTALLYLIFIGLCVLGLRAWLRDYGETQSAHIEGLPT
ncbi:MAG: nicotinamide mononucleotide transporter [Acidobacteria bacterium]|nr:nicotinamide mononucleotide transporter [Acidobacteriota bacterium]MCB9399395.1 nicotinamide mononucleotide transporter [Acidobacteriota bacterium]